MDKFGADTGWLVIFDRSKSKSRDEKIYFKEEEIEGKTIAIAGC